MVIKVEMLSTEDNLRKMFQKLPKPIGVVVFGPDSKFKKHTVDKLGTDLNMTDAIYSVHSNGGLPYSIENDGGAIVVMDGRDSHVTAKRQDISQDLRDFGAKSIIGVCVYPFSEIKSLDGEDYVKMAAQIANLSEHKPNSIGLDYLITFSDEELP